MVRKTGGHFIKFIICCRNRQDAMRSQISSQSVAQNKSSQRLCSGFNGIVKGRGWKRIHKTRCTGTRRLGGRFSSNILLWLCRYAISYCSCGQVACTKQRRNSEYKFPIYEHWLNRIHLIICCTNHLQALCCVSSSSNTRFSFLFGKCPLPFLPKRKPQVWSRCSVPYAVPRCSSPACTWKLVLACGLVYTDTFSKT